MAQAPIDKKSTVSDRQFPVVGIGASAGGLDAFKLFVQAIPEKTGMAYVYVQHLSPLHQSNLPEIVQKSTMVPVHLIADNINLEPPYLYHPAWKHTHGI